MNRPDSQRDPIKQSEMEYSWAQRDFEKIRGIFGTFAERPVPVTDTHLEMLLADIQALDSVILTAYPHLSEKARGLQAGMRDYFVRLSERARRS
jgi:hypothetical protein